MNSDVDSDEKEPRKIRCIICHEENTKLKIAVPTVDGYQRLVGDMKTRNRYGDNSYADVLSYLEEISHDTLVNVRKEGWHQECYKAVTHKRNIERLKERFEKCQTSSNIGRIVNVKVGRPKQELIKSEVPEKRTRRDTNFSKALCILCQENKAGLDLHVVSTISVTNQLKDIARYTTNDRIRCRLSFLLITTDELRAMTDDMKYHLPCLMKHRRTSDGTENVSAASSCQILSDLEIIDWVKQILDEEENVSMNDVRDMYSEILRKNGVEINPCKRLKPHLKELLGKNLTNINFIRPVDVTKSEQIFSNGEVRRAVSETLKDKSNEKEKVLMAAAKILREEIENCPVWKFTGTFEDYVQPKLLSWFCNYVLHGSRTIRSTEKKEMASKSTDILTQHFVQAFRTDRQMTQNGNHFRTLRETPLSIGSAIFARFKFRSKFLSDFLFDLNVGCSYEKSLEIEDATAEYVFKCMEEDGFYKPISVHLQSAFYWFALDNFDICEDTPNGKDTTHATGICMFGSNQTENAPLPKLQRPPAKTYLRHGDLIPMSMHRLNDKPVKKLDIRISDKDCSRNLKTFTWVLASMNIDKLKNKSIPGTWGAFNSLVSSKPPQQTSVVMIPPLIRQPPTDVNVLNRFKQI